MAPEMRKRVKGVAASPAASKFSSSTSTPTREPLLKNHLDLHSASSALSSRTYSSIDNAPRNSRTSTALRAKTYSEAIAPAPEFDNHVNIGESPHDALMPPSTSTDPCLTGLDIPAGDYKATSTVLAARVHASLDIMVGIQDTISEGERTIRRHQVNTIVKCIGKSTFAFKTYCRTLFHTTDSHNPYLRELEKLATWTDCGDYNWQRAKDHIDDRRKQLDRTQSVFATPSQQPRPSQGSHRQRQLKRKSLPIRSEGRGSEPPVAPRSNKTLQKAALSALEIFQGIAENSPTSHLSSSIIGPGLSNTGRKSFLGPKRSPEATENPITPPEQLDTPSPPKTAACKKRTAPQLPIQDSEDDNTTPRALNRPRKQDDAFSKTLSKTLSKTSTILPREKAVQSGQRVESRHKRKLEEPADLPRARKMQLGIGGQHTASRPVKHKHSSREFPRSLPVLITSLPTKQSSPVEQSSRVVTPKQSLSNQLSKGIWRQGAPEGTLGGHLRERRRGRDDDLTLKGLRDEQRKEGKATETSSPVRADVKKAGSSWAGSRLADENENSSPEQKLRVEPLISELAEHD